MESANEPRRRAGRPLSFDRDAALQQAMLLFWRQGYETTSLNDLTKALGITPPSIYAAFGDKRRLFLAAVERYTSVEPTPFKLITDAPSARDAAWALLEAAAVGFTGEATPSGCLLATAAMTGSPEASNVRAELAAIRRHIEEALAGRILDAVRSGELPADSDAEALSALVIAIVQGMSTLARDGASRDKLIRVARLSLSVWKTDAKL